MSIPSKKSNKSKTGQVLYAFVVVYEYVYAYVNGIIEKPVCVWESPHKTRRISMCVHVCVDRKRESARENRKDFFEKFPFDNPCNSFVLLLR